MGLALMVIACVTLAACGAGSSTSSIRDLLTAGQAARESGRNAECIADYTAALKESSDVVAAYVGRGDCYLNQGNPAAARHDYSQAATLSPNDPLILIKKGTAEHAVGNDTEALVDLKNAAALATANPDQIAQAAGLLEDMGYHAEALSLCTQGLVRYPNSWSIHNVRAGAELNLGAESVALQDFASAVGLASGTNVAFVLSGRASYYVRVQRYTLAIADYTRALTYDPTDFGLLEGRAKARLGLGDLKGAERDLTSAVELAKSQGGTGALRLAVVLQERGELYLSENLKLAAANDFREALNILPRTATSQQDQLRRLLSVAEQ